MIDHPNPRTGLGDAARSITDREIKECVQPNRKAILAAMKRALDGTTDKPVQSLRSLVREANVSLNQLTQGSNRDLKDDFFDLLAQAKEPKTALEKSQAVTIAELESQNVDLTEQLENAQAEREEWKSALQDMALVLAEFDRQDTGLRETIEAKERTIERYEREINVGPRERAKSRFRVISDTTE